LNPDDFTWNEDTRIFAHTELCRMHGNETDV
jgi:hypothetical protein